MQLTVKVEGAVTVKECGQKFQSFVLKQDKTF